MIATKRERIILLVTLAAVGLFVLNWFVIDPLFVRLDKAETDLSASTIKLQESRNYRDNAPRYERRWREMVAAGLKSDASESEAQALRALNGWALDSGLVLSTLQPDRAEASKQQKDFQQITLRVTGTGSMRAVSRFLWSVQTSSIPLHPADVQISSRKEGSDDLTLTLAVTTLALAPASPKPDAVKVAGVMP